MKEYPLAAYTIAVNPLKVSEVSETAIFYFTIPVLKDS